MIPTGFWVKVPVLVRILGKARIRIFGLSLAASLEPILSFLVVKASPCPPYVFLGLGG